jgi:hypothetical protein
MIRVINHLASYLFRTIPKLRECCQGQKAENDRSHRMQELVFRRLNSSIDQENYEYLVESKKRKMIVRMNAKW